MAILSAEKWLRYLPACMIGTPPKDTAARLANYATRLAEDFPPGALTHETAKRVGSRFDAAPTFDALASALRYAMPAEAASPSGPRSDAEMIGDSWGRYIGKRLGEGADPERLLGFLRTHAPPGALPGLLAAHFPAEVDRQAAYAAEVQRDKARAVASLAAAVGQALRTMPIEVAPIRRPPEAPPPPEPPAAVPIGRALSPEQQAAARAAALAKAGQAALPPITREPDGPPAPPPDPGEAPASAPGGQRLMEEAER